MHLTIQSNKTTKCTNKNTYLTKNWTSISLLAVLKHTIYQQLTN